MRGGCLSLFLSIDVVLSSSVSSLTLLGQKKKPTFKHNVFWEEETLSVKINEGRRKISVKSHAIFCKKTDDFSRIGLYFLSINKNQPFCPVEYWLNLHCLIREFKK